jgi:NAD(P)-dependent dehydrogenase (short-subunit alcohol dehydrogenase family)
MLAECSSVSPEFNRKDAEVNAEPPTNWLGGKAVVVTGGGGAIGAPTAKLASAVGASVVVNDVNHETAAKIVEEIRATGGVAIENNDNIADWQGAGRLIETCVDAFGRIDGLFNNAALCRQVDVWTEAEADIRAQVEVNVLGTIFPSHFAIEKMKQQRSGAIVNMTSSAVWGVEAMATYGASKAAAAALAYCWAIELKDFGVSVNTVAPQAVSTMATVGTPEAMRILHIDSEAVSLESSNPSVLRRTPGSGAPPPENVAPVIVFLLAQPANVSGQFVQIRGSRLSLIRRGVNHREPNGVTIEHEVPWTLAAVREAFSGEAFKTAIKDQPVTTYVKP